MHTMHSPITPIYGAVAPANAVSAGPSGIASSAISALDASAGVTAVLPTSVDPSLGSEFIEMNSVWTGSLADARRRAEGQNWT